MPGRMERHKSSGCGDSYLTSNIKGLFEGVNLFVKGVLGLGENREGVLILLLVALGLYVLN